MNNIALGESMRVVLFVPNNHIFANKIIKTLLRKKDLNIAAIIVSKRLIANKKNNMDAFRYYLKISGFDYVFHQMIKVIFFQIASFIYSILPFSNERNVFFPYRILANKKSISILHENDINNAEFIKIISGVRPDLFVSIFFNQIFQSSILRIPTRGTINVHPGILPSYRGVSPTFWVLANGEDTAGVTVHTINDKAIDEGKIIAQKRIKIMPNDTEHTLYWRCANDAILLLTQALGQIRKGCFRYMSINNLPVRYFSVPTKQAVRSFRAKGRKFFTLSQLLRD